MSAVSSVVAYCGLPPAPAELWNRWRFDPFVVAILLVWLGLYIAGARSLRATPRPVISRELALFCAGWIVAALALVSPLCPLSVSLFSARATQHVVLTLLAAPLIASARPLEVVAAACGIARRPLARASERPLLAAACFAVLLWLWHSPLAYAATFQSVALYWTMHVTLFGSACWLWSALLRREGALVGGLLASVVSSVQMGLLGALITLAPRAFYAPHFLTTDAWGLTPLQDQQLGGAIMWVPGCTVFLLVVTVALAACLARNNGGAARVVSEGSAR